MANKVNFSSFSTPSDADTQMFIVGYDAGRQDSNGRFERKIPINGIKFVNGGIRFKAKAGAGISDPSWYELSIQEVIEDGVKQYFLNIDKIN